MFRSLPKKLAKTAFRCAALVLFAAVSATVVALLLFALGDQLPRSQPNIAREPSAELLARLDDVVVEEDRCGICSLLMAYTGAPPLAALDSDALMHLAQWLLAQPPLAADASSDACYGRARRLYVVGSAAAALDSIDDAQRTLSAAISICESQPRHPGHETNNVRFDELTTKAAARLGPLCAKTGKWTRGERAFRASIAASQRLLARQPEDEKYQTSLALAWVALGDLYCSGQRQMDGKKSYDSAAPVLAALAERHPDAIECQTMLARISGGRALLADTPELAESLLLQSIDRLHGIVARFPEESPPAFLLVQQSGSLFGLLLSSERYADAIAAAPAYLSLAKQSHTRFLSPSFTEQRLLALRRGLLIYALCPMEELRDPQRALETARALADLQPSSSFGYTAMALAHNAGGNWQAAIDAANLANAKQRDPANLFCLAVAYEQIGQSKLARDAYNSAVELLAEVEDDLASEAYDLQRREAARVLGIEV